MRLATRQLPENFSVPVLQPNRTSVDGFLLLLFPNGRLPSRRWRFLAWSIIAVGAVSIVSYPLSTEPTDWFGFVNPLGIKGALGEAIGIITSGAELLLFGAIVLSALSLVFRYRGAGQRERQQLKWFAYAAAFVSGYILLRFFVSDLLNTLCLAPRS